MPKFSNLLVSTIREFDGGWNTVTSDLNLPTKFSKTEENMFYGLSGTKQKRYGTRFVCDVTTYPNIEETWNTVTTTQQTLVTFAQKKELMVAAYDTVTITSPENIKGTYEVKQTSKDSFILDISKNTPTVGTEITFYKNKRDTVTQTTTSTANVSKKLAHFSTENHSDLLIGHTITITSTNLAGIYTVVDRTSTQFSIDVSNVSNLVASYSNVNTVIGNRNILFDDSHKDNRIINITYFLDKLIAVTKYGEVLAIDALGNSIIIFNDKIAKQVGAGSGWDITTNVCFAVFNGILTIWNGVNKPLAVDLYKNVPCNYLVDESTQSNSMIPIAKYAISINHYLVAANVFDEQAGEWKPDRVMISDFDSIGTFNDGTENTLENGGVSVDIGKIVESSISEIRGLSRYRTQLIVSFDEVSTFGTLGGMTDAVDTTGPEPVDYKIHKPDFNDVISDYGCVNHRTFQNIAGDVGALSFRGLGIFRKASLSNLTTSGRLSTIIGSELYKTFKDLSVEALTERIWSVYNAKEQQYMLFIPNSSTFDTTSETTCFVYTIPSTGLARSTDGIWSKFTGWNFQCGCSSALNEIFLVNRTKVYILGNEDNPIYADFVGDPDFVDEEGELSGKDIEFTWELGWQDMNNRQAKKTLRYIGLSTNGTSPFTLATNYDYIDEPLTGEQKIDFVGGDSVGWGNGKQVYGGGRRTNTEQLFAFTSKFNLIKLKIYGKSKEDLKINSISLFYQMGNIRR